MNALGHPLTYPTFCFIDGVIDGGCGARVYAHSNGDGDFVLFDSVGQPWPIHECYLYRFCTPEEREALRAPPEVYTDREKAMEQVRQHRAYKAAARLASEDRRRRPQRDIERVNPESCGGKPITVFGYVQSIVERRADKVLKGVKGVGAEVFTRKLGHRRSQITIVDDFRSYTAYADLRTVVVAQNATVKVLLRPEWALGINHFFVCDDLDVCPI